MKCTPGTLIFAAGLLLAGNAVACKPMLLTRLTFPEGSADLEPAQIAKLAQFIDRANSMVPKYAEVSIDGAAAVKIPERTVAQARRLAKQRTQNVTRAFKQLQTAKVSLETTSGIYEDNRMPREASNDFVVVQFHPAAEAAALPDCNPIPALGFRR